MPDVFGFFPFIAQECATYINVILNEVKDLGR